jgi:polyribonucleotide nucleotidyltransferase
MSFQAVSRKIGDKEITIETGKMAKLADGAVVVKCGKSAVLVTACMSKEIPQGIDFFPLTVNYIEKFYAAGKIPGGYIKREGKPSEKEILVSRLIDRPIRPLFPENFYNEVQVIATTLSADQIYSTDILGIIGASAALSVSSIPFLEPAGGVRIVYKDGNYIINPSLLEVDDSQLDLVVAGTRGGLTMVEGGAKEVEKEVLLKALELGQKYINEEIDLIEELVALVKQEKRPVEVPVPLLTDELKKEMKAFGIPLIKNVSTNPNKKERSENVKKAQKVILEKFAITKESESFGEAKKYLEELEIEVIREQIIKEGIRPDGRKTDEIRPISIELDILENVHGSALFTRGQTQSLGIVTLGSSSDVQYIDGLEDDEPRRFMLHYNFPPFCTGEVKKSTMTSRREIGHGHLAWRAIAGVLPDEKDFPYTIRLVSEVLESNGSSSMATVCSSSLSLMATGVPVKKQVAGIAMGLIWDKENSKYKVLSDIQGLEDHFGDMDFKVAGTKDGITAFQMDVKTIGLTKEMMKEALDQAWEGKEFILSKMNAVIEAPRGALSENAPKIKTLKIPETEIGSVIGGGGRVIKKIMAQTEVSISIEDDGKVMISSKDESKIARAVYIVEHIAHGFRKEETAEGTVTRIEDYGVFVELVPGQSALLHRSNFLKKVSPRDAFKIGDVVKVKVLDIDEKRRLAVVETN